MEVWRGKKCCHFSPGGTFWPAKLTTSLVVWSTVCHRWLFLTDRNLSASIREWLPYRISVWFIPSEITVNGRLMSRLNLTGVTSTCSILLFGNVFASLLHIPSSKRILFHFLLFSMQRYWKHHHSKKVLFYRVGIGEKDDERNERHWKIMSLTSLRQMLNHTNTIIDYLKMDIEGGEWPVLSRWLDDGDLLNVKQLAMEIHLENPESIPGKYNLLQRLEASGFTRFFARENPYTTNSYLNKYNVTGPSCLELAWYNTKFVR